MNLYNKNLLLLGGSAFSRDIKKYANQKGFRIISIGKNKDAQYMKIADEAFNIDFMNFEAVAEIVKKKNIHGIFCGAAEESIDAAITISEMSGVPFYTSRKQWNIFSNKRIFKDTAKKYKLPVIKDYVANIETLDADAERIILPVMIKPVDSNGARGNNVAYNKKEFVEFFNFAVKHSKTKEIIVEELITDAKEFFLKYIIQDGNYNLISGFTKHKVEGYKDFVSLPILHVFPSMYIREYKNKYESKFVKMFKDLEINNGIMILQAFIKNGEWFFIEAGYRMGGAQIYKFTEHQNSFNFLEHMINLSLTGKMDDSNISSKANPFFKFPCCNYYIPLKQGIISSISGLDIVENMEEVLNITKMCDVGDKIDDSNSLQRVCLRLHVWAKTKDKLAKALEKISHIIKIQDQFGAEMQLEKLEYSRCLEAINNS